MWTLRAADDVEADYGKCKRFYAVSGLCGMIRDVNEPNADFDYDKFLEDFMSIPPREMPSWIPCRSLEEAEAFAAWCVENDVEEPEIARVKI